MSATVNHYQQRIERETGRQIDWARVTCQMCQGHGFSAWEPMCEACTGEGSIWAWVYADCRHLLESEECEECFEPCAVFIDLGQQCGRPVSQIAVEPYTPAKFTLPCCDRCAAGFKQIGYEVSKKEVTV